MSARVSRLLAFALLAAVHPAHAESAFVIDKLLVGIHESKDLDSAILKVLPTGTRLEVLQREGELAYVGEPDGVKGWIDAAYLSASPPAELRVAELEKAKAALEDKVKQLSQGQAGDRAVSAPDAAAVSAQVDALTKENTELKGKLSDEKLRAGTLQSEVSALRAQIKSAAVPPDTRLVEMERSRDELERDLDEARQKLAEYAARASQDDISALVPVVLREYSTSIVIGLLILAALAFGAGVYLVDYLNRRRHGGFRV